MGGRFLLTRYNLNKEAFTSSTKATVTSATWAILSIEKSVCPKDSYGGSTGFLQK